MKEILYNEDNLTKEEIDETVIRTKALMINSKDEILMGYCHNTYQFPGGHLDENETLEECLIREVKEEMGIDIFEEEINLFMKLTYYTRNYRNTSKNRENIIYYYWVKTDKTPDFNNNHLDENEKDGNYEARYLKLEEVNKIIQENIIEYPLNDVIGRDNINAINEYRRINENRIL